MQWLPSSGVATRCAYAVRGFGRAFSVALGLWITAFLLASIQPQAMAAESALAGNIELQDHRSYSEDDDALEAARFRERACNGDAVAAVALARMYLAGNGWFAEDIDRGKAFLLLAIKAGNYQAAADLAVAILKASQDDRAVKEAAKWVKVALYNSPTPEALMAASVVKMMSQGKDLAPAYQEGVRWYLTHEGKADGDVDPVICGHR